MNNIRAGSIWIGMNLAPMIINEVKGNEVKLCYMDDPDDIIWAEKEEVLEEMEYLGNAYYLN